MPIPANLKTPGAYIDINLNTQRTGLPTNTQKVLFITPDNNGPEIPVSIYDKDDAAAHFGGNSIAARMIVAAVKTNRTVDVQCLGKSVAPL